MATSRETQKPIAAFILSLAGGTVVLLSGIYVLFIVSLVSSAWSPFYSNNVLFDLFFGFGFLGIIWGILMIIGATTLYAIPRQHQIWGSIILVFAIASWFGTLGGFVAGFTLGLIGGILGIIWSPESKKVFVPPPPPTA